MLSLAVRRHHTRRLQSRRLISTSLSLLSLLIQSGSGIGTTATMKGAEGCAAEPEPELVRVYYGGSFNPLHVGHQTIVRRLCRMPEVAEVCPTRTARRAAPGRA